MYFQDMVRVNHAADDINRIVKAGVWEFVCFIGREWDAGPIYIWALFKRVST